MYWRILIWQTLPHSAIVHEIILVGFKFGEFAQNRQFAKLKTSPKFPAIWYYSCSFFRLTLNEMHLFIGLSPSATSDPLLSFLAPPVDGGSECTDNIPLVCFNSLNLDAERLPAAGTTANIPSSLSPSSL